MGEMISFLTFAVNGPIELKEELGQKNVSD
jgi:hypothetical protein